MSMLMKKSTLKNIIMLYYFTSLFIKYRNYLACNRS